MISDKILLIPSLSKELNLIGFKKLPYNLKKSRRKEHKIGKVNCIQIENESIKIVFESKKMISALVSVCIELLKDVKTSAGHRSEDHVDKLNFKISNLERQINSLQKEIEKKVAELMIEKDKAQQLQENIEYLKQRVKDCEIEIKKITQKNGSREKNLLHKLKRQEFNIKELHAFLWKKFNLVDKNYFPANFEIINLHQPDFNKLWCDIKYSRSPTKEKTLRQVICVFQNFNQQLMEDNHLLKTLLVYTFNEIKETMTIVEENLSVNSNSDLNVDEIFSDLNVNLDKFKNYISRAFNIIAKTVIFLNDATFKVSDDLFICWTDVLNKLRTADDEN